jgi:hypothetical protein
MYKDKSYENIRKNEPSAYNLMQRRLNELNKLLPEKSTKIQCSGPEFNSCKVLDENNKITAEGSIANLEKLFHEKYGLMDIINLPETNSKEIFIKNYIKNHVDINKKYYNENDYKEAGTVYNALLLRDQALNQDNVKLNALNEWNKLSNEDQAEYTSWAKRGGEYPSLHSLFIEIYKNNLPKNIPFDIAEAEFVYKNLNLLFKLRNQVLNNIIPMWKEMTDIEKSQYINNAKLGIIYLPEPKIPLEFFAKEHIKKLGGKFDPNDYSKIISLYEASDWYEFEDDINQAKTQFMYVNKRAPRKESEDKWDLMKLSEKKKWMLPKGIRIPDLRNKEDINLSNKNLVIIPPIISINTGLKRLDLSNNNLRSIPLNFFNNLQKLEWLDLRNNLFRVKPKALDKLPGTTTILLDNNLIYTKTPIKQMKKTAGLRQQTVTLGDKKILLDMVNQTEYISQLVPEELIHQMYNQGTFYEYITEKYSNNCIVVPSDERGLFNIELSLNIGILSKCPNYDAAFFWGCPHRFIVIPLDLVGTTFAHANVLIYDKKTEELERFDPNVETYYGWEDAIDNCVKNTVSKYFPIKKYYRPIDFCPQDKAFQFLQAKEPKQTGNPKGFCKWWSQWYLDLRLAHPELSREEVIKAASKIFSDKNLISSMTNFIKGYGIELLSDYENYLETHFME